MPHDVFISHSTKDKSIADAVCATLEAERIRCWIAPRDILPGMDWGEAVINAISQSRILILIFSSNANDSQQIKREVERAASKQVPILPFRIENIEPSGTLEYYLGTPHWLDALTPPLERHLQHLVESVRLLLPLLPSRGEVVNEPIKIEGVRTDDDEQRPAKQPLNIFLITRTILLVLLGGFFLGGIGGLTVRSLIRSNVIGDLFVPGALFGAIGGLLVWAFLKAVRKGLSAHNLSQRVSIELLGTLIGGIVGWILWIITSRMSIGNHWWYYGSIGGWIGLTVLGAGLGLIDRLKTNVRT